MKEVQVSLERSGFIDLSGGTDADWIGCLFVLAGLLVGGLIHLLVFRGGWTAHIVVLVDDEVRATRKIRYRSKAAALADLDHQRELAADLPLDPPAPPRARLRTRGGTFRRPW